jgi:hypothetical protein
MTTQEYRELYQQLREYQLQKQPGCKVYTAIDVVLTDLFPYYYNQNQEQCR